MRSCRRRIENADRKDMSVICIAIQLQHGQNVEMFAAINWAALGSLATLAVAIGTGALVVVTCRGPREPNEPNRGGTGSRRNLVRL